MGCLNCGRGLYDECSNDPVCELPTKQVSFLKHERTQKDDTELNDPLSTWRKRAALQHPLHPNEPCEWKGLANVGGGKYPIVGCKDGKQQTIHHGPVKIQAGIEFNFNQEGNLHRICGVCHHVWHHWNDAPYESQVYETLPHQPRTATEKELNIWASGKTRPQAPEPRTKPITIGAD